MAYKFQLGTATLSGSILQSDGALIQAATAFKIGDATITEAELEILDGATVSTAELNLLDGSSAGTVANSKAVIYGSSGEVNATTLQIAGSSINSTAAELNLVDGSSAGTVVNSKAVIYGSSGEVNATTLQVGGVSITSTPAELNLLDGVSGLVQDDFTKLAQVDATATELNVMDGDTAASSTTLVAADRFVVNDDGTMKQVALSDVLSFMESSSGIDEIGGNLTVAGNLTVNGTTTTISTTNLEVQDKNILLAKGAEGNGARGAGLNIELSGDVDAGFIRVGASDDTIFELQAPGNAATLTLDINASKTLTVAGNFNIDADITATAAEINILDGLTASTAELNLLDAVAGSSQEVNPDSGIIIFDADSGNVATKVTVADISAAAGTFGLPTELATDTTADAGTITLTINDHLGQFVRCKAFGENKNINVQLPAVTASHAGKVFRIKHALDGGVDRTLIIKPNGSDTIEGAAQNIILESPGAAVSLLVSAAGKMLIF